MLSQFKVALAVASGLGVLKKACPREAAAFEASKLAPRGLAASDLPLALQEALQELALKGAA